jgi:hypothetical protein
MLQAPRPVLVVALLGVLLFATGCGGADPGEYVKKVNKAQASFAKTFAGLQADITPESSAAADRATLDRFQAATNKVVRELEKIEAPDDVSGLHKDLIAEISQYGKAIERAKQRYASNSPKEVLAARDELTASVGKTATAINTTIEDINKKLH